MADQGARATYTPSVYLSVTDDANRWRAGTPLPQQLQNNESKVSMLMQTGQGLAIEKNLSKYGVKVLAAETRKQAWIRDLRIGPKSNYVVYIIKVTRIRDGASAVSAQRYSALRNLYNSLKSDQQVRAEGALEFPGKRVVTEESFKGDRADVSSEFVRHRKEQLGSFLRQLFNKNPELWDVPEVQDFFNMEAMEHGKSYAERAHAMAAAGLRTYDPGNPSEWNPYSVAMQAAEANRNRNNNNLPPQSPQPPKDLSAIGVGGAGSGAGSGPATGGASSGDTGNGQPPADGEGGGIGAWFRGLGGGGNKTGDQNILTTAENNNAGGGGWAARPGWLGGNGGGGGGGGEGGQGEGGAGGMKGSLVEIQVKVLQEMGFPEETARIALKASGYDTNLAAEYCVTGIPPGRLSSLSPPLPIAAAAAPQQQPQDGLQRPYVPARGSGVQSSVASGFGASPSSWQPGRTYGGDGGYRSSGTNGVSNAGAAADGGGSSGGVGMSSNYRGWNSSSNVEYPPEGPASRNSGRPVGPAPATVVAPGSLDWRTMPRRAMGEGRTSPATGTGGGTVDV